MDDRKILLKNHIGRKRPQDYTQKNKEGRAKRNKQKT